MRDTTSHLQFQYYFDLDIVAIPNLGIIFSRSNQQSLSVTDVMDSNLSISNFWVGLGQASVTSVRVG